MRVHVSSLILCQFFFQVTPAKFLRTAFGIRGLSSAYISRVFLRTEMALKSKSVLTGSRSMARSRSTDNLPTSQSQINIQMMSHTLTIREVRYLFVLFSLLRSTLHLSGFVNNNLFYYCHIIMVVVRLILQYWTFLLSYQMFFPLQILSGYSL